MIHATCARAPSPKPRAQRERFRMPAKSLAMLALALLLLTLAGRARADCDYTNRPGSVTFTPPATITLPNNPPIGTILWTSSPISPASYPTLRCVNTTNSGVVNLIGGAPGSDDTLFPSNVAGLSYRLLHPDASSPLQAYPNETISPGTYDFSVAAALQLVVTGTITPGSVLTGGQLAQWNVDMCLFAGESSNCKQPQGPKPVEVFNTSSITFVAPACTGNSPTVTLPTVYASAFTGTGTTTGQTPFTVQLTCTAASTVSITLSPGQSVGLDSSGVTGSTGTSQKVGVQLLQADGSTPIQFGNAYPAATTPSGNSAPSLIFYARYYQTGSPVVPGTVTATATYILTYQ